MQEAEYSLATRAAWLSYIGGFKQEEIARRLGVSRVKVNRLIAQAHRAGLVRVFVEGNPAECVELENALVRRFNLTTCLIGPSVDDSALPLKTLASVGAHYLRRVLEEGAIKVIGVGHGRTLAATVNYLPRIECRDVRFVSLLGSLTRHAAANPFDVIHRLAERTGAEGYFMPVPFFADSVEAKAVLMAQESLRDVFALARRTELVMVGIGEVAAQSHLMQSGMITADELREVAAAGATGEVLGHFLSPAGQPVDAGLNVRSLAVPLAELQGREVIAIAGGQGKAAAIEAVLNSGVLTGLITDEVTAAELVARMRAPQEQDLYQPLQAQTGG